MLMIAPNSRVRKEKQSGEVKGEYGIIWGKEEGGADYGEWCDPVSKISHHMKMGLSLEGVYK